MRQPETRVEVYAIKVTLLGTSPPVWRRILVPREITLRNLHRTLQTVIGWTNSHLHQFVFKRQKYSDPKFGLGAGIIDEKRTRLGDLVCTPRTRFLYEYDFGDGWQHELLLEEVLLGDESFHQICVAGKRSCPPEDCGGSEVFAELLTAIQDAKHPNHEEACEWLGDVDPESFSADEINRRLRRRKH